MTPWGPRPGPGHRGRRRGAGAPPRAIRGTRSNGPRAGAAGGRTEAGANDSASTDIAGRGRRFRLGVDQPDYVRFLRCFVSFAGAALHPSVTRRAASYGFYPRWVSIQPSEPKAAEADPGPCRELPGPRTWPGSGSESLRRMLWKTVRRSPSGMCRPACRTGFWASPCLDAEGTPAGKSTGRESPIVSGRSRMFNNVKQREEAVANGARKHPRNVSAGRPCCLARHLAAGHYSAGSDAVSKALGQPPWPSMA